LKEGVRTVLNTLRGKAPRSTAQAPSPVAEQVIKKIISIQKKYWKGLSA